MREQLILADLLKEDEVFGELAKEVIENEMPEMQQ